MNLTNEIIKHLYYSDCLSVSELSACTGKSIPKIAGEVTKLLSKGLLLEDGFAASTGGRRAMRYSLSISNLPIIVTIAIDQFYTSIGVMDIRNTLLIPIRTFPVRIYEDEQAFAVIIAAAQEVLESVNKPEHCLVGLTMPGFVDSERGLNHSFPSESLFFKVRQHVEAELGYPTAVANDSSAIAVAEHKFGKGKGSQDILVINFNWGVGLGMIIGNKIYKGHSGYAGEFSHIPLANSQKLCSCGKKGCLEVEASLVSLFDSVKVALLAGEASHLQRITEEGNEVALSDLIHAFAHGDQVTLRAVKNIIHMLGKGISTLIHIMNPERIIVSGKGERFGDDLLPALRSSIQEYCIPRLSRLTDIVVSDLKNVQTIASACIAMQQPNIIYPKLKHNKLQQQ
ncbi:ROK family protein [Sphingobacterium deserti]|uniref:Glucokinase n=1 Tax=Sphingobacterium deserti TaxID=1229276 RepID=A0A0B8T284_9SPHI|nr:ROK family protein [Sphingobacterium deserti]KGE15307.1 glucokinase [Sphingobacterium deserti]